MNYNILLISHPPPLPDMELVFNIVQAIMENLYGAEKIEAIKEPLGPPARVKRSKQVYKKGVMWIFDVFFSFFDSLLHKLAPFSWKQSLSQLPAATDAKVSVCDCVCVWVCVCVCVFK